jgi:predicted ATP-grasp superfamily ATP-dependent carboligase
MKKCEELLSSLNWNGVAMFEFKYTTDSIYYLMEINPRLWGSLQLAIDSGVDFPKLLLCENVNTQEKEYKVGVKLRWELGLLDHFFIQLKRMKLNLLSAMIFKNYFQFFKSNTKNEIFRISDFGPFKFELTKYFKSLKR